MSRESKQKKNNSQKDSDLKYNYLRRGYCQDDHAPILPDYTRGLRTILSKMDISEATKIPATGNFAEKQALCRLLQEQQAETVEGEGRCDDSIGSDEDAKIPPDRLVRLRHGPDKPKIHCYDVMELASRLKADPKFRTLFSSYQLERIQRLVETVERSPSERSCHESDGNKASCQLNSTRCAYNEWSVLGRLFSSSSSSTGLRDKECYPQPEYIRQLLKSCSTDPSPKDKQSLELVLFDMLSQAFILQHIPQAELELSVIEMYDLSERIEALKLLKRKELHQLDDTTLCRLLEENIDWYLDERTGWWVGDRIGTLTLPKALSSSDAFLDLLGWNVIPLSRFEAFWKQVQPVFTKLWKDDRQLLALMEDVTLAPLIPKLLHFAVNGFFGGYSLFGSWASFFFLNPGGWVVLNRIRKEQSVLGVLGVLLGLLLDGASPALTALQQLNVPTMMIAQTVKEFGGMFPGGNVALGQLAGDLLQGLPKVKSLTNKLGTALKATAGHALLTV